MSEIRVVDVVTYPVKSLAGVHHSEEVGVWVTENGLAGDRCVVMAGVGEDGGIAPRLSLRECPELIQIMPTLVDGGVLLSALGREPLWVPMSPTEGPLVRVKSFGGPVSGVSAGPEAAGWLSGFLGREAQILIVPDDPRRTMDPEEQHPDALSFTGLATDGYPIHLVSLASLRRLNALRVKQGLEPIDIDRFRANIIIDGEDLKPFEEDEWQRIVLEDETGRTLELIAIRACERCVVTEVDPKTGQKIGKVLKSLRDLQNERLDPNRLIFGVWMAPAELCVGGLIRAGQRLRATSRA